MATYIAVDGGPGEATARRSWLRMRRTMLMAAVMDPGRHIGGVGMERTATCVCGQLSVGCRGEPARVSLCHCLACQKRTGSTYGIAAFFRREAVESKGRARRYMRSSDSGYEVTFHFCPDCGSTVFWEPHRKVDMIAVAVGAFADPAFPPPSQAVYEEHRHPWIGIIHPSRPASPL